MSSRQNNRILAAPIEAAPELTRWLRDATDIFNAVPSLRHDSVHTSSNFTPDLTDFTIFRLDNGITANLPIPGTVGGFSAYFKNIGAGTATLSAGTYVIDASTSTTLEQYDALQLYSDGTQYWVI